MSAVNGSTSSQNPVMSKEEIKTLLTTTAIEAVERIASEHFSRMERFRTEGDSSVFDQGIFYDRDCLLAFEDMCDDRLVEFQMDGSFHDGRAPEFEFKKVRDLESVTGYVFNCFLLRKGISASEGLASIQAGPSILDCSQVCQIACYEALKKVFDKSVSNSEESFFDVVFAPEGPNRFEIGVGGDLYLYDPLHSLTRFYPTTSDVAKDQFVHFGNIEKYREKHLRGPYPGHSVICSEDAVRGQEKFIGLGTNGVTQEKMSQLFLDEYNQEPLVTRDNLRFVKDFAADSDLERRLFSWLGGKEGMQLAESLAEDQLTSSDFKELGGGGIDEIFELDRDKIYDLIQLDPLAAQKQLSLWNTKLRFQQRT